MDNTVQNIKDRLNIVDVIGGYLQLKKAGANFRALCPFHNERTPSFNVSAQRQIWHCFGCGAGGDIFGFVMQYENVDFKEALKILAAKAGVELPQYRPRDPHEQEEKDLLLRINDFAARAYHQNLIKDERATVYLRDRGLSAETITQWQIGFAPADFHFLHHSLLKKNLKEDFIIKSGVCVKGEKGPVYDRFRGRVTFPIFDYFGKAVGFSARILPGLDDGKTGKYINSPETLIYQKSKILFGLNFAKDEIRKNGEAIIVEGQMDCVASHQAGVKNVVASSGTALTLEQLNLLKRLTVNLKFCFDADQAGGNAMRRAVENVLGTDFSVKIIALEGAKDPDELIKKDPKAWQEAINAAPVFLDYYSKQLFKDFKGSVEEKKQISRDILPLLAKLSDPVERDHYLSLLARDLGTEEKAIRQALEKVTRGRSSGASLEDHHLTPAAHLLVVSPLEKEILGGLLVDQKFRQSVRADIDGEDFENLEIRQAALAAASENFEQGAQDSALAKESVFMVESLLEQLGEGALLKRLLKSYSQLKVNNLKKKQKVLQNEVSRAEALREKESLRRLQAEFARVSKLRMEWEKK